MLGAVKTATVPPFDPEHFQAAAGHFSRFFKELSEAFLEREPLLGQFALALISREHLLMTGPPGTAKSQLAASVLGRIVDESTGRPSVFARQFTENTVQTDLIGPIDFKTLLEKGRTEHFTDEGMLGEVHAFLDEVFDGRDMMLRSTLNLLLERELKQGGRTTKGRIECAFMTSNRYIAEVLESSRDVLLAFLDRIAFVSFVPRGFAEPDVLGTVVRRQAGGTGRARLSMPLSIQDIDVLQEAADSVYVSDAMCNALVKLVESLDAELATAAKADPNFLPTRYFSTRTVVRAVKILRAITVYDKVFHHPERPLEARFTDFQLLHLHLLLAGMSPERIARRLTRETDPRERRQLEIARTEREIFERCLRKIPAIADVPAARPTVNLEGLELRAAEARMNPSSEGLVSSARALAEAASSGLAGAAEARALLAETVSVLCQRALRAGVAPPAGDGHLLSLVEQLSALADGLEKASPDGRPTARWLRGRAMAMIDQSGAIAPEGTLAMLQSVGGDELVAAEIAAQAEARVTAAEVLASARRLLDGNGADVPDAAASAESWKRAISRLEEEQAIVWDAMLRATAAVAFAEARSGKLSAALAALSPTIQRVDAIGARLQAMSGEPSTLKARVFGPRMKPLVSAAFARMTVPGRRAVVDEVRAIRVEIDRAGLGSVLDPGQTLAWAAAALVRNEKLPRKLGAGTRHQQGFEEFRAGSELTAVQALMDIAISLHVIPKPNAPAESLGALLALVRSIPAEIATKIAASDLDRLATTATYLEEWWKQLESAATKAGGALALFEAVVQSGFLRSLRSESVLLALPREARDIAEIFPNRAQAAGEIARRIESLDASCTGSLVKQLQDKVDDSWTALLKKSGG